MCYKFSILKGTFTLIGGPSEKNIITFVILYVIGNVSIQLSVQIYTANTTLKNMNTGYSVMRYWIFAGPEISV